MGREARRVPLDFDWPLGETWEGYLLPDRLREDPCPDCRNGGTAAYDWLQKVAYVICGLADDATEEARGRKMHPYLSPLREISYGGMHGERDPRPGEQFAEIANGLCSDASGFLGRDVYRMHGALIAAAGLSEQWGICPTCEGHASIERYEGQRDQAEAWEATEPPTGDGWQMWETTSEGSPTSPVFATPEELADYCAANVSIFGHSMAPREQWLKIITGEDFAHVEIAPGIIAM
jgi:hypothetical protein